MIIRNRTQLIEWFETHGPAPYRQMLRDGAVEVLGLFNPLKQGFGEPGWILRITSRHGKIVNVGVYYPYGNDRTKIACYWPLEVAWGNYAGDANGKPCLKNGDRPDFPHEGKIL